MAIPSRQALATIQAPAPVKCFICMEIFAKINVANVKAAKIYNFSTTRHLKEHIEKQHSQGITFLKFQIIYFYIRIT